MKKLIAFMLALAMVLSMAACGDGTNAPEETEDTTATETSGDAITDLVTYELTNREVESLNILIQPEGNGL